VSSKTTFAFTFFYRDITYLPLFTRLL